MMARSDHSDRSKAERIARLKQRLADATPAGPATLAVVLKGVLDLLADEL